MIPPRIGRLTWASQVLTRAGVAGIWTAGVQFVGAHIVEVCAQGAVGSADKAGVCA